MNIRGYFMLLASTIWRTVVTQLLATFRYRVAGGSDNALLPERKGRAVLQKVYGKTVKFNQLVKNGNFADTSDWSVIRMTISASNNILVGTVSGGNAILSQNGVKFVAGNTYYIKLAIYPPKDVTVRCLYSFGWGSELVQSVTANQWNYINGIVTITSVPQYSIFTIYPDTNSQLSENDIIKVRNVNVFDLTAMGISNLTPAEVKSWLALNVGTQDYYPYDEGSLVSFKGQGVKVTGWNKFHVVNGSGKADVKKDVKYYVGGLFNTLSYSNGDLITVASDHTFTATKDDTITFTGYSTTSNPTVLNIYTGTAKDGTYEPYHEEIVDLSGAYINVWDEQWEIGGINGTTGENMEVSNRIRSTNYIKLPSNRIYIYSQSLPRINLFFYKDDKTYIIYYASRVVNDIIDCPLDAKYIRFCSLTGVTTYNHDICINVSNADINGTYYPHALQSAGSVTDEDTETELTKKIFAKKLKDLTWSYSSSAQCMYAPIAEMLSRVSGDNRIVLSIAKYTPDSTPVANTLSNMTNMCYRQVGQSLGIKDTNYGSSDISQFVSDLGDTEIQFELATPVVVPHDTPMQYAVDKYSTEEVIVPASVAGEPTSTALVADIEYQKK